MEVDHQEHLHRHCLSRESMRNRTWPQRERGGPQSPLRLAPVRWPQRIPNGTLSGGTEFFTVLDKTNNPIAHSQGGTRPFTPLDKIAA